MNDEELSQRITQHASRYRASDALRASVRTQIALQRAAHDAQPSAQRPSLWSRVWPDFAWRGMGLGFASGVVLTALIAWGLPWLMLERSVPADLVASHVRALKVGPLIEVASNDRHTVKPWFQGKLDYAPTVIDLAADGFPLLGGRAEQVPGAPRTPVAALAYSARKHIINVWVWPNESPRAPQAAQRSGFTMLQWSAGGMQVWVVSDVEAAELERFGQRWRALAVGQ
jgi:anti-sigma factor RsiW